jgi:hypothetical protein
MSLTNVTLADPTSTLLEIGKMTFPSAVDLATARAISIAPAAARDWEARVQNYLTLASQFEERNESEGNAQYCEGWIYAPLVFWPSAHYSFVADVLAVVQADITATVVLPAAYNELKTRIDTFIANNYPNGTGDYLMISTHHDGGGSEVVSYSNDTADSEVDPANYEDDDDIAHAAYVGGTNLLNLIRSINNLIYHTYLDDDDVDLTKGGEFLSLLSYPICLLYVIMNFLRTAIPKGTGDGKAGNGTFLTTAEWTALSSAATNFLTN